MRNKQNHRLLTSKHIENNLIVVDAIIRDYDRLAKEFEKDKRVGYCYMIFVDTTLDVALQRNRTRERKVEPVEVKI